MVNSVLENETSHSRPKSANGLTSKKSSRRKRADEISSKDIGTRVQSPTKNTTKSIENVDTETLKACVIPSKNQLVDKMNKWSEFKLNIKRVDETNYVSTVSPCLLKMNGSKSYDNKLSHNLCSPTTPKKKFKKKSAME